MNIINVNMWEKYVYMIWNNLKLINTKVLIILAENRYFKNKFPTDKPKIINKLTENNHATLAIRKFTETPHFQISTMTMKRWQLTSFKGVWAD